MSSRGNLKRKSFFVDEAEVRRAKRITGARTDAEVVRLAIRRINEMEEFWRFMDRTRRKLPKGSFSKI